MLKEKPSPLIRLEIAKGKINNEALYLSAGHKSYAFGRYHGKERQQCQLIKPVNCR